VEPLNGQVAPDATSSSKQQVMINGIAPAIKTPTEIQRVAVPAGGKTEIWRRNSDKSPTRNMIKSASEKEVSETIVNESNTSKNELELIKSPNPQQNSKKSGTPTNAEKNKQITDRKQVRSSPSSSYSRSFRPGLVPTPVGYPYFNWSSYYLGTHHQQRPHISPIVYGYHPAYIQYQSTINNHPNNNSSNQNTSSNVNTNYPDTYDTQDGEKLSKTNLYIRGLHNSTTDEDLVTMCRMYGNIISTKAILHKDTNQCYGFVDFDSPAAAQRAVAALQSKGIQAQMAKQQEQDPTNLYLSSLPKHVDEQQLQMLLSAYGNVISTRILRDSNGNSKCVGFARMESKEICEQIINKLNGQYLPGGVEPMLVKFADGGPKKNKQDKVWQSDSESYDGYEVRSPVPRSTVQPQPTARVTPVVQNQMMSHGHASSGTMTAYPMSAGGVGWGVHHPSSAYAVAVSPHGVPVSPTHVETIPTMQQGIPQMANQMAQMHIHGNAAGQYIVPGAGAYGQQNNWHGQMSQTHAPVHVEGESTVIMTASEVESSYAPQQMAHHHPQHIQHHSSEQPPIQYSEVDHQTTRVVYAPYTRK